MSTFGRTVRRGLPRHPGGDPWPPAADAPIAETSVDEPAEPVAPDREAASAAAAAPTNSTATDATTEPGIDAGSTRTVRRGLPRVPGGEPWPPLSAAPPASTEPTREAPAAPSEQASRAPAPAVPAPAASAHEAPSAPTASTLARTVRRGLPRVPGGEPWPPADFIAVREQEIVAEDGPAPATTEVVVAEPALDVSTPLPYMHTVFPGAAARTRPAPAPEPVRIGPFTRLQWAGATVLGGLALLILAGMAVAAVRFLLSTEPLQDFLTTYPGEYHLPEGAPVGFPAWLGWQHFFNVFLMVLIIRSGLQVRNDKRPSAFWTPRGKPKAKISLSLWFHQSLDILWIINGVIFVILLFVSGQWMRIIPTSWEVFPNALSAVLQYISLDWPTENGWVNYNSVQQLAYFATVFLAAPLAIITGVRMSGVWPKNAKTLNRLYPVEWARKVHFPTMIYFVLFIFVHVVLVFATGALRNLNHMYAAQGSADPNAYADNWAGFWIFFASMVVIGGAWVAARPLVLAPIAKLFGTVSGR